MKKIIAGLVLAALVPLQAAATTVKRMEIDELVDLADLIVTAEFLGEEARLPEDGEIPFTFLSFQVEETFKGEAATDLLTLRVLGGKTDEIVVLAAGMPTFDVGETYLLFVKDNGEAVCPILGWGQGKLQLFNDSRSGRKVLLDETGTAIGGISEDRWVRGPRLQDKEPVVDYVQFREGGLLEGRDRPLGGTDKKTTGSRSVPSAEPERADVVIGALREFVRNRSQSPRFEQGKLVWSADLTDAPKTLQGRVAAPARSTVGQETTRPATQ